MNSYDIMVGNVENIIFSTNTTGGGGENNHVSTTQTAIFELNGQAVRLSCDDQPFIYEGNKLFLIGKIKNGILEASSFRNIDKNIISYGKMNSFHRVIFCYIFSFIPPVCIGGWYFWYKDNIEIKKDNILDNYEKFIHHNEVML